MDPNPPIIRRRPVGSVASGNMNLDQQLVNIPMVSCSPDTNPDLTVVLLGHVGVGKSASGNTILGDRVFESKLSLKSVTSQIFAQTRVVFKRRVTVVDTPGILGFEGQIRDHCLQLIRNNRVCLFLLVLKIDRFTPEQMAAAEAVIRVIGEQQLVNSFVLFTGGDGLDNEMLEEFINEDTQGSLSGLIARFRGRYHLFNNKDKGPQQVRELLQRAGHLQQDAGSTEGRRIVLLGLPGSGKSASGNTILGSVAFTSGCNFSAVTTMSVSQSAIVDGRELTVVDTPGFTEEFLTPRKLYEEIMKSIMEVEPGPHVFVLVVKIGRISTANIKLLKMLLKLFGNDATRYMVVVFTHGDNLKSQSMSELIQADRGVSRLVSMCGNRYCVFDNTKRRKQQVQDLLSLMDQMVTDNKGQHYTSELFRDIQSFPMKVSIRWREISEWFAQQLKELDPLRCCRRPDGYVSLDED